MLKSKIVDDDKVAMRLRVQNVGARLQRARMISFDIFKRDLTLRKELKNSSGRVMSAGCTSPDSLMSTGK